MREDWYAARIENLERENTVLKSEIIKLHNIIKDLRQTIVRIENFTTTKGE